MKFNNEKKFLNEPCLFIPNIIYKNIDFDFNLTNNVYNLFFNKKELIFRHDKVEDFSIKFLDSNINTKIKGLEEVKGKINYIFKNGNDNQSTSIPGFKKLKYQSLYKNIDLIFYENDGYIECDFIVSPKADYKNIKLEIGSNYNVKIDNEDLIISDNNTEFKLKKPIIYQIINKEKYYIKGKYVLTEKNIVSFDTEPYDKNYTLIIDPVILFSTFLGGSYVDPYGRITDIGMKVAVDSEGMIYVTGGTSCTDFPLKNPFQNIYGPTTSEQFVSSAFISKIDPTKSGYDALIYSTYLGGIYPTSQSFQYDEGIDIKVDSNGYAYILGVTSARNLPTTKGAYQSNYSGVDFDLFVAKLSQDGSKLEYLTYFGGNGNDGTLLYNGSNILAGMGGICIDDLGNAYISSTTSSNNFIATQDVFQSNLIGQENAFIAKLSPDASELKYFTYFGKNATTSCGIDIDSDRNIYIAGNLYNPSGDNFTENTSGFNTDATNSMYLVKINSSKNGNDSIEYFTCFGEWKYPNGDEDICHAIAVDKMKNAHITGIGRSNKIPLKNAIKPNKDGNDSFIIKIDTTKTGDDSLVYSTYFGGNNVDITYDISTDSTGNTYVTGRTDSADTFPITDIIGSAINHNRAFISVLGLDGQLIYSSILAGDVGAGDFDGGCGITVDNLGNIYATGFTSTIDFPTTSSRIQSLSGKFDVFITKLNPIYSQILVTPSYVSDNASQIITLTAVSGYSFINVSSVKLKKLEEVDIIGEDIQVNDNSTIITVTFNLEGKTNGEWDIEIKDTDNNIIAYISEGISINHISISVDIFANKTFRKGSPHTSYITITNNGNIELFFVPITIKYEVQMDIEALFQIENKSLLYPQDRDKLPDLPINIEVMDYSDPNNPKPIGTAIFVVIPYLPPGQSIVLPVKANKPPCNVDGKASITVKATIGESTHMDNIDKVANCWIDFFNIALGILPGYDCVKAVISALLPILRKEILNKTTSKFAYSYDVLKSLTECVGSVIGLNALIDGAIIISNLVTNAISGADFGNDCINALVTSDDKSKNKEIKADCIIAVDPNYKSGPIGIGSENYIIGNNIFDYYIAFENLSTATAAAQKVVIKDVLDKSKLDLSTLKIDSIAFGSNIISPYTQILPYSTDIDLRPSENIIVRINVNIDSTTGELTWELNSIDPITNLPVTDPTVGFLPPNIISPEGQGFVSFSIMPNSNLNTNDKIINKSAIIFDNNASIETNQWINTIDKSKPISKVNTLADVQTSTNFTVSWGGTDDSGILTYTIYYSENNGPFKILIKDTISKSILFTGENSKIYSFFSIATDNVGNIEDMKSTPDTNTRVFIDTTKPISKVNSLDAIQTSINFTVSWEGTDDSGIATYTIYYSENNGPFKILIKDTISKNILFTGENNKTYSFFSIATDIYGNIEDMKYKYDTITNISLKKQSDLILKIQACACRVRIGNKIKYIIKIINKGPDSAINIVVTDIIQDGVIICSAKSRIGNIEKLDDNIIWKIPKLNVGEEALINIVLIPTIKFCKNNSKYMINTVNVISDSDLVNSHNSTDTVRTCISYLCYDCRKYSCNCNNK